MNREQAIEAAQQVGVNPGDHIFIQSEGQINHPHFHSGQTSGELHTDGWMVQNDGGVFSASKLHTDDR